MLFQPEIVDLARHSPSLANGFPRVDGVRDFDGDLPRHTPEASSLMAGRNTLLRAYASKRGGGSTLAKYCLTWIFVVFSFLVLVLLIPASNRKTVHKVLRPISVAQGIVHDGFYQLLESWDARYDKAIVRPHNFHENGHFIVQPFNKHLAPLTSHPILTLIEKAEQEWNQKVRRQSRSLKEAAAEYRRRYRRNPPKGFDKWWAYAIEKKIVLTDEYNQIHKDLEPFWALEPIELSQRAQNPGEYTFTVSVTGGKVFLFGLYAGTGRAEEIADLIGRFSTHLGDLNMTFTPQDGPGVQLGWYHKEKMIELAKVGEYLNPSDPAIEGDPTLSNWANGCPPDSPLRRIETSALQNTPTTVRSRAKPRADPAITQPHSFIYDHTAAMDICRHPEILPIHGYTSFPGTNPGPLIPLFAFVKTTIHSDILVTPLEQYHDTYIGDDPDFKDKPLDLLLWRGSTTGADFFFDHDWRSSQRSRLHFMTHETAGVRKVLVTEDGQVKEVEMAAKEMNDQYMDVSFSGGPAQCDEETCDLMSKLIDFQPRMELDESYKYKYVIDVDGNGWSGRFHRLMSMKALVLKSTIFPEWYSDRIQPWLHYVPVKVDYTDIYDIMTFFRGTPQGEGAHEDLAAKIGLAGKEWARDHWRREDMAAYMFRLTLEWSRLLRRSDEESQDYTD